MNATNGHEAETTPKPGKGFLASLLRRQGKKRGSEASASAETASSGDTVSAGDFVKPTQVFPAMAFGERDEALMFISAKAVELGIANDVDDLMSAFLKREDEGTTGMMDGFAVPHAKCAAIKHASVMVVKSPKGIEGWDTMDGKPVHVAIALLIPDQAGMAHLKLLSKVAEALMDERFRASIKAAQDSGEIAKVINARLG